MLYDSEHGNLSIALLGDVMPTRRLSVFREERYVKLRELLVRADAVFANLETCVHRYLEGRMGISGGTYMTTEPHLLEDLKWLGINLVSCANNHAFDYGEEGILGTCSYLDAAGITHAGSGRNLREARSPAYLEIPSGRVALIAATSQFRPHNVAGEQRPDVAGRPGINPLRYRTSYTVDNRSLNDLSRIGAALGLNASEEQRRLYSFAGLNFEVGEDFAIRTIASSQDVADHLQQIKEARRMADWVIVSLHCHTLAAKTSQHSSEEKELEQLADFAVDFAHRCIDAGADIFVGHGPQKPLGIEIYRDRPVFFSLGSTIFELETPRFLPGEAYSRYNLGYEAGPADFVDTRYQNDTSGHPSTPELWRQIIAKCNFSAHKFSGIELYPLDLGFGKPRWQRGRPLLADHKLGRDIIERVSVLSQPFGTKVSWHEGCGVISPG